jgi:hypothetical protein
MEPLKLGKTFREIPLREADRPALRKIVVNRCYGGFGLSDEAIQAIKWSKGVEELEVWDLKRDDAALVAVVESLGEKANGRYSKLEVVSIPADVEWEIEEYDGSEWVSEKHRTW